MSYLIPFSQKLRQWRLNAALSQLELGQLVSMDQAVISRVESGKRWLNVQQYGAIFSALGLTEAQRLEAWALLDQATALESIAASKQKAAA